MELGPLEAEAPQGEAFDGADEGELVTLAVGADRVDQHGVPAHQQRPQAVEAELVANDHDLRPLDQVAPVLVVELVEVAVEGGPPGLARPLAERPGRPEHLLRLAHQHDFEAQGPELHLHRLEVAFEGTQRSHLDRCLDQLSLLVGAQDHIAVAGVVGASEHVEHVFGELAFATWGDGVLDVADQQPAGGLTEVDSLEAADQLELTGFIRQACFMPSHDSALDSCHCGHLLCVEAPTD